MRFNLNSLQTFRHLRIFAVLALSGCVTTHSNAPVVMSDDGGLLVSCDTSNSFDHPMFTRLLCTFENTTVAWQSIRVTGFRANGTKLSTADEARLVYASSASKSAQDEFNTGMVITTMIIGGALVAAAAGEGSSVGNVGTAAALGGTGYTLARGVNEAATNAQEFGATDLQTSNGSDAVVRIPPKSFVKRALLLELAQAEAPPLVGEICIKNTTEICNTISLNRGAGRARISDHRLTPPATGRARISDQRPTPPAPLPPHNGTSPGES